MMPPKELLVLINRIGQALIILFMCCDSGISFILPMPASSASSAANIPCILYNSGNHSHGGNWCEISRCIIIIERFFCKILMVSGATSRQLQSIEIFSHKILLLTDLSPLNAPPPYLLFRSSHLLHSLKVLYLRGTKCDAVRRVG